MHVAMVMTFELKQSTGTCPNILSRRLPGLLWQYRACACWLFEFKGHHHGNMHPFFPVLSPSFLYHPYIPSFKSKDFSFTCLLSFFAAHCILYFMLWGIYCLGLFIVVYTLVVLMSCCRNCVMYMYVRQLSLLQLLIIWAIDRHFHSF